MLPSPGFIEKTLTKAGETGILRALLNQHRQKRGKFTRSKKTRPSGR